MVAHRCPFGYGRGMTSSENRDVHWWLATEDDDDLVHLAEAVRSSDWVVFASGNEHDPNAAPPVALKLSNSADGRKICTGMIVGLNEAYPIVTNGRGSYDAPPVEVTSRALRRIPVAELIGRAVHAEGAPDQSRVGARVRPGKSPAKTPGVRRSPGPKGHPGTTFPDGGRPVPACAQREPASPDGLAQKEQLHADRTTVARWVKRARDMGFLGDSQPGRAGEIGDQDR